MKQTDIEALLSPAVLKQIAERAEKRGIADPFAIAIARSGDNAALAAVRVQQLVGLIPTREDADNLRRSANGQSPQPWLERHPAPPAPPAEAATTEAVTAAPPAEVAPAPAGEARPGKRGGKGESKPEGTPAE